VISALLMVFAGVVFALTKNFVLLLIAGPSAVISLSDTRSAVLSVEQARSRRSSPTAADGRLRVVQPRRLVRDGAGLAGRRRLASELQNMA